MIIAAAPPRIATEEVFAAALGIAAALLLVGTSFLLRWQRNRQRFELMRLAFENGATNFPQGPPYWLVSMREAVTTLALGISLLAVGGGSYTMGTHVPPPTAADLRAAADTQAQRPEGADLDPERRLGPPRRGPRGQGPDDQGPPEDRRPAAAPPPPVPSPPLDRYRRAQAMQTVGLLAMGCGAVLTLLGLVRAGFARVEREHAGVNASQP